MKQISLVGLNTEGKPARIASEVIVFWDDGGKIEVTLTAKAVKMVTGKATYYLAKHPSQNYYFATCNGHKVQISLKKIVGEVRYW